MVFIILFLFTKNGRKELRNISPNPFWKKQGQENRSVVRNRIGISRLLGLVIKIIFGGKKGSQANATKCLTSGAVYKTNIQPKKLSMQVNLPMELDIDEEEASILETIWHNATETVLRPYFYQNNASIPQQTASQQINVQLSEDSTGEESVFLIDRPHIKGEDAPPIVARYGNSVLIAVADGMGGAGFTTVTYKGETEQWLG